MARHDGRRAGELRPIEIVRGFTKMAAGSVLIRWGQTHVLCTASWQDGVPKWREGKGLGWLTAEYDMLPGSTPDRRPRSRQRIDGRAQEIQRLIGRSLRAIVDTAVLGENTIQIDCDVLQADGGTRTAAITGAYVALCDAVKWARKSKRIVESPVTEQLAAVSVGRVGGKVLLDLDYIEDSGAEVDCNIVMTGSGRFVEVQGAGEGFTFTPQELDRMLKLAKQGINRLHEIQAAALRKRLT